MHLQKGLITSPLFCLHYEACTSVHQVLIVLHQNVWRRDDLPIHSLQKLQLQQCQLLETDTANARVGAVGPETVAKTLGGRGRSSNKVAMDCQRTDIEVGV